jgi:phenylpropionate dioxygenase-like ring-hydroxylating dioxygenase large terminal subunit
MEGLKRCWFPILRATDLSTRPIPVRVLGVPLVLFRGANGEPSLLEDRCPHRLVPLSLGRVEKGELRCAYHGWTFDSEGKCTDVPSLPRHKPVPKVCVRGYLVRVVRDTIWASLSDQPYDAEPRGWLDGDQYGRLHMIDIACDHIRILENLVDNAHAAFVHRNFLRSYPTQSVRAVLHETASGLRVETHGERAQRSFLFQLWRRIASSKDLQVVHVEEYFEPNAARVEYMDRTGSLRIAVQFVCVPQDEAHTRVMYRCTVRSPIMPRALLPLLARNVGRLMDEDRLLLEEESAAARADGEGRQRLPTTSDVPGVWVARAAREYAAHGPKARGELHTREIEYRL